MNGTPLGTQAQSINLGLPLAQCASQIAALSGSDHRAVLDAIEETEGPPGLP